MLQDCVMNKPDCTDFLINNRIEAFSHVTTLGNLRINGLRRFSDPEISLSIASSVISIVSELFAKLWGEH